MSYSNFDVMQVFTYAVVYNLS